MLRSRAGVGRISRAAAAQDSADRQDEAGCQGEQEKTQTEMRSWLSFRPSDPGFAREARAGIHIWTAPDLQEVAQLCVSDRLRSYVRSNGPTSHMTAAKMGFATRVPNSKAVSSVATGFHGVSRVSDRPITPSAPSRASSGLGARRCRSHAELVRPRSWQPPPET